MRSEKELIQLLLDSEEIYNTHNLTSITLFISFVYIYDLIDFDESFFIKELIKETTPIETYGTNWNPIKEYLENLLKKYE
jgi:hypothetical protein